MDAEAAARELQHCDSPVWVVGDGFRCCRFDDPLGPSQEFIEGNDVWLILSSAIKLERPDLVGVITPEVALEFAQRPRYQHRSRPHEVRHVTWYLSSITTATGQSQANFLDSTVHSPLNLGDPTYEFCRGRPAAGAVLRTEQFRSVCLDLHEHH